MQYHSQWQERIGWKLFPAKHCFAPEMDDAHDVLCSGAEVHFSFIDRLKIVLSGIVRVDVRTTTQHIIGECRTEAVGFVAPPKYLQRKEAK